MRYRDGGPGANQTDDNDCPETDVLTCYDSARWNPPGKEESKEKSVINICSRKGCDTRGKRRQISIHNGYDLSTL